MFDAIYCKNGHYVGTTNDSRGPSFGVPRIEAAIHQMERVQRGRDSFCSTCGAPTIRHCEHCQSSIEVGMERPSYCNSCGKPFPWTASALEAAREYTDELEGLSSEEKTSLKATFDDLTVNTPRSELAIHRFMKFLRKIGPSAGDVLRNIIVTVATEATKKGMGL